LRSCVCSLVCDRHPKLTPLAIDMKYGVHYNKLALQTVYQEAAMMETPACQRQCAQVTLNSSI
jgi:hypothetical protein